MYITLGVTQSGTVLSRPNGCHAHARRGHGRWLLRSSTCSRKREHVTRRGGVERGLGWRALRAPPVGTSAMNAGQHQCPSHAQNENGNEEVKPKPTCPVSLLWKITG